MNFLIINDDGIKSEFLRTLIRVVDKDFGYCYVAVPKNERSATSHSITITNSIAVEEINPLPQTERTILVEGTPADCVRVALTHYEDITFDYVLSGINIGENLSYDALYSGTLAAAKEASIYGFNSIALSTSGFVEDVPKLEENMKEAIRFIINNNLFEHSKCLNVNIPTNSKKIRLTSLGTQTAYPIFTKENDTTYRISYSRAKPAEPNDKDHIAYDNGETSITPILIDQTDYEALKLLNKKKIR